jgi:hypothetical protein
MSACPTCGRRDVTDHYRGLVRDLVQCAKLMQEAIAIMEDGNAKERRDWLKRASALIAHDVVNTIQKLVDE